MYIYIAQVFSCRKNPIIFMCITSWSAYVLQLLGKSQISAFSFYKKILKKMSNMYLPLSSEVVVQRFSIKRCSKKFRKIHRKCQSLFFKKQQFADLLQNKCP